MDSSTRLLKDVEPLLQYIMLKQIDNVKAILEEDSSKASQLDSTKKSPLHASAHNGSSEIAELIISTGGSVLINGKDSYWITPLHQACKRNNYEVASTLLEHGADLSARTKDWQTPAHSAVMNNSVDCLKLLLDPPQLSPYALNNNMLTKLANKADINMGDRTGQTCLHLAAYYGFEEICRILIENGANVKQGDKRNRRPLHLAVHKRHQGIIQLLIDNLTKEDIDLKDKDGNTALHVASTLPEQEERFDLLSIEELIKPSALILQLIEAGADLTISNNNGNTVIHTACLNGNAEVLPTLLRLSKEISCQGGKDVIENNDSLLDKTNDHNQTALHFAAFIHEMNKLSESPDESNCLEILLKESTKLIQCRNDKQMTALHVAAKCGSSRRVNALISAGAQVDVLDMYGRTPLHIAAQGGHFSAIDSLLKVGADCKLKDGRGRTALHCCAQSLSLKSCQTVLMWLSSLENKIDPDYVNSKDLEGMTSLHHGAFGGSSKILEFLISSDADVTAVDVYGRTPLHYASANSHIQCVMILVKNPKTDIDIRDKTGCTSLHTAASKDYDGRCVEYLISRKADPWIHDIQGYTPLHYAASNGNLQATMSLVQLEEVESSNTKEPVERIPQSYALYLAVLGKYEDCLVVLLSRFGSVVNNPPEIKVFNKLASNQMGRRTFNTGDVNTKNTIPIALGQTLLHVACRIGSANIVEHLLDNGADLLLRDCTGFMRTALHYAAYNGNSDCVKSLLNSNRDIQNLINMKTSTKLPQDAMQSKYMSGKTALMEASMNGYPQIVRTLCQKGAKIDEKDKFGRTALYFAASKGREECAEILIEMNADIRKTDRYGKTALHMAAMTGHVGILGQLIDKYKETSHDISSAQFWYQLEDNDGFTPLQWAAYNGHEGCVEILTLHNPEAIVSYFNDERAVVGTRSGLNFSPVHCAAERNHVKCLSILNESLGIKALNFVDGKKRKPLHIAIMNNSYESSKFLIDSGAEINCRDNEMRTPLMLGSKLGNLKCVQLLLSHNCDIDQIDSNGNTALHYGCDGDGSCANIILEKQEAAADISHQNCRGQTPLHIAASRHLVDTCELLLIKGASVSVTDSQGLNPVLATASTDDAITCLTMLLEAVKMESQTGRQSRTSAIHAARRSFGGISFGSFDSSLSSHLSDASIINPNETSQSNTDKNVDRTSLHVKKRSLPILMEDVDQAGKFQTDTETEVKHEIQ